MRGGRVGAPGGGCAGCGRGGGRSARRGRGSGMRPCMTWPSCSRNRLSTFTRPMLGMKGKGCAGSTASGVRTGKTRSMNQWSSPDAVGRVEAGVAHLEAGFRELGAEGVPDALLVGHEGGGAVLDDFAELLGGGAAIGADGGDAGLGLAHEAGDADGEELVEVGGGDADEAEALEQRVAGVLGLLHDAVVEVEPAQLAVDEAVGRVGPGRWLGVAWGQRDRVRHGRPPPFRSGSHLAHARGGGGGGGGGVALKCHGAGGGRARRRPWGG